VSDAWRQGYGRAEGKSQRLEARELFGAGERETHSAEIPLKSNTLSATTPARNDEEAKELRSRA